MTQETITQGLVIGYSSDQRLFGIHEILYDGL